MKKRVLKLVLSIAALLLIVIIGASFYFYNVAIARADKSFLNGNPDLAVTAAAAEAVEIDGDELWWEKQTFETWTLVSEDGLKLHAYYLPAAITTDKTVILAHGYSGQAPQMNKLAQMYREKLGYNVLLPDARGHGRSEGRYIGFGWPERKDYLGWIASVLERSGTGSQIVLHGVSMGGATVMMTSGEELPPQVKAIVEDCGYTSVQDELSYQLKRMYRLPSFPLLQSTSLLTKIRAGYAFNEASALKQVKKTDKPMLFIHGDADLFVPTDMVYELYENGPQHKKLYVVPGAGHGQARQTDPVAYDREVSEFIGAYVK
ncbi:alpha/beta hydrolase [Paenibacillus radicis (ex Gao et al. 2016)]|uniref:Alpha/beta hydrolase n=1 Tax=Paenibacillus radicis (ex Gao et al. 2016) TaxID=1737354 RepID=A0A917HDK6_9BACL|nr:alpha/beta hydrolase [Paenibacillus radicis (ex Gao et al. 2016)]GGG75844.1 alpha/beta hydrolase [Paenibacillus radicis (ex Gao et al. 2016)]